MARKQSTQMKERRKSLSKARASQKLKSNETLEREDEIKSIEYKIHQYKLDLQNGTISKEIARQKIKMFEEKINNLKKEIKTTNESNGNEDER